MVRKSVAKGLFALALSFGVMAPPSLAATAPASNPTDAPAAPASSTTSTTTTSSPSATTTSSTTTTAAPAAIPATTAAPASAAPVVTPAATVGTTTQTTTTAITAPATTTTTIETKKEVKKEEAVNYSLSLQNACNSESVMIAEYLGYEKNPDIRFNQPARAEYHIVKILKGPPLNRRLPVKYEFHDHSDPKTPAGWKFNDKDMPEKGSKWLIFINNSVPHNGQFETYEGSYGRQPMTEENLNKVYQFLGSHGEEGYN
jgi:hypothetical protein